MYNIKESKLNLPNMQLDYITFGSGTRPLVMIQGLNSRGIKGSALSLAYMYRIFAKDFKVCLFDRRPDVHDGITVHRISPRQWTRWELQMPMFSAFHRAE